MLCDIINLELAAVASCTETDEGMRVATQCLYPSFDPVHVYVSGYGEGFRVHDGGGAMRSAWDHGRDLVAARRTIQARATASQLSFQNDAIMAEARSSEWLASAILSVANISASAAFGVIDVQSNSEDNLKFRIFEILNKAVPKNSLFTNQKMLGRSGKRHTFDFAVRHPHGGWLLIDGVTPHHVSISSKYVSFSDVGKSDEEVVGRFAVYEKPLDDDDASLLQQVADLVPLVSLDAGVGREMS